MLKQIARKIAVSATLLALVTPVALASTPLGTDPEPGVVHTILAFLGLAKNVFLLKRSSQSLWPDAMAKMVFLADVPAGLSGAALVQEATPGSADSIFTLYPGSCTAIGTAKAALA